jgi:hypothetical protein
MSTFAKMMIERAVRSAFAAFLATAATALNGTPFTVAGARGLVVAAGAAAVSAALTVLSTSVGDPKSGSFVKDAPGL